jgi:hypothetical protein
MGERRAVRPFLGHGVVSVGGGEEPGTEGKLISRTGAVVAGAVGPLVVASGKVGERRKQPAPL